MKEVKIKINVEKIFTACQGIKSTDDLLKHDTPKDYTDLIDRIFKDSIEIASSADDKIASSANDEIVTNADDEIENSKNDEIANNANDEIVTNADDKIANSVSDAREKEPILKILNNRVREFFAYNTYGESKIRDLYKALKDKKQEEVRKHSIMIINELIQPNTFIYNPQDGIHIEPRRDNIPRSYLYTEDEPPALHSRIWTLEMDCTDSSTLESIVKIATESLDREFFYHFSYLLFSEHSKYIPRNEYKDTNILKKYLPQKKNYSIDKLYTLHADDGTLLVDYGLKLMYSKYYEIKELCETVKKMEANSSRKEIILRKISKVLAEEELRIVTSIIDNIYEIKNEKYTQKGMIDAIEYIADKKDMPKVLNINSDLSNFKKDYLDENGVLTEKVNERKDSINREIEAIETDRNNKKETLAQAKREGKSAGEIEGLEHSIDELNYKIFLLIYKTRKEKEYFHNIDFNMNFYDSMEPIQKKHILKKMEEVALRKKIELKVKRVFRIRLKTLAYISIVSIVALITLAILFSGYILNNEMKFGQVIGR
ncbi:hypothetical protein NEMIN01_2434 [Nematocida minor]|uniref:uncharacterized protein n=1 Tax=Nematocida minor TaxID=1912983 RepID=UPI00221E6E96|nr:uncharacterized protein NEMIN01_2434 [Nematocida minor]KAI5193238.1 hypothetical protein NEMIN01_2434 [Nematocida minor]